MSVLNVLVVGGTRFNGLAAVQELVKHGHRVTTFNRGQSGGELPKAVHRLYGDRHDHPGLRKTFQDLEFDCVIDTSAYNLADDVKPLLEALEGRIGHYIFISSTGLYTSPSILPVREGVHVVREEQTPYGWNKVNVEEHLFGLQRTGKLNATTAALSMVFGPHNNSRDREQRMYARLLLRRAVLIPGDGNAIQQTGHVDDQARALRLMMLQPITYGKRYNLTGIDVWTDTMYVDIFADIVGVEPDRMYVPAPVMDELWNGPDRRSAMQLVQRLGTAYGWDEHMFFSVDRLRKDIGWEPEYTFQTAVEQTYQWFRSSGIDPHSFDFSFEDRLIARLEREGVSRVARPPRPSSVHPGAPDRNPGAAASPFRA